MTKKLISDAPKTLMSHEKAESLCWTLNHEEQEESPDDRWQYVAMHFCDYSAVLVLESTGETLGYL